MNYLVWKRTKTPRLFLDDFQVKLIFIFLDVFHIQKFKLNEFSYRKNTILHNLETSEKSGLKKKFLRHLETWTKH